MLGSHLCITVLTGRRLPLLQRTLSSLSGADRSILEDAHVVAYLNGHDSETERYLRSAPFIDRVEYRDTAQPEPIGNAVSRLAHWVPSTSRYHLHLEDDWQCTAPDAQFLLDASMILEADPKIGQVRMRLASERVLSFHMITKTRAPWNSVHLHGLKFRVAPLHFTFNPSLVRVSDLPRIYPADHELTAARNYMRLYPHVAQLVPGTFRHIGDEGKSLRVQLGRA